MINTKKSKVAVLFMVLAIFMGFFLWAATRLATSDRQLPRTNSSSTNTALRGSIISADGFSVASSHKVYEAAIYPYYLNPDKKELFINLYCIYTGADPAQIAKLINAKAQSKERLVLSNDLDARTAAYLQQLGRKLNQNGIFISRKVERAGKSQVILLGLEVRQTSELREYMAKDAISQVVGYINSQGAKKGIENYYDIYLSPAQDGFVRGPRDIGNNIILTGSARLKNRDDGYDVRLGINLKLQVMLEKALDIQREFLDALEVTTGIMDSATGQIIALATSARYNPNSIKAGDGWKLNPSTTERPYEPGSIMKPFVFSLLLEHKDFNTLEMINTHNGRYRLGPSTITDTHPFDKLPAEDIIVQSSNIGMVELSSRLNGKELYDGLRRFGFSKPSGIDMPNDKAGSLPNATKLNSSVYRGTVSYGYGLSVTFMQLLKAFNAFNNKGVEVPIRIASAIQKGSQSFELPKTSEPEQVISDKTASVMKRILIKTVQKGTAAKAAVEGLEIGGKTGTAHIAQGRGYSSSRYNGSFFGFANDASGHRYTIGVLAREPKKRGYYFGALSALPVFRDAVMLLVQNGYLIPSKQEPSQSIEPEASAPTKPTQNKSTNKTKTKSAKTSKSKNTKAQNKAEKK